MGLEENFIEGLIHKEAEKVKKQVNYQDPNFVKNCGILTKCLIKGTFAGYQFNFDKFYLQ
jgi:hypothetical protein